MGASKSNLGRIRKFLVAGKPVGGRRLVANRPPQLIGFGHLACSDGNLTERILPDEDDDPGDPDTFDNNDRWTYTYDADGNRLSEEDPLGFITEYEYDSRDRLELIIYPDGDMNEENNPTVEMTYDDASNVETRTNG